MKRSRRSLFIIMMLVLALSLTACGGGKEEAEEVKEDVVKEVEEVKEEKDDHYPVEIKNYNYAGEEITQTFEEAPKKVLAVYQNSIETMLALGLEDHIVAASGLDHEVKPEYKDQFEKINYLTEFAPDKETVVMMEPDMILSWYSFFGEKTLGEVDYWHDKGIKTYMSLNSGAAPDRTLENEFTDILNLGKIFNVEDRAEAIVDEIKDEIAKVEKHIEGQDEKVRVLILEKMGDNIHVYGEKSLGGDMVKKLGAELISPEENKIGEEDIIGLNPDVIFTVYMDREEEDMSAKSIADITENDALQNLDAVKNERVHSIQLGEMYASGIRTMDGILKFAKGIYPELYN